MNDETSVCRYRGILQPSADSNQRDASQGASIHLSKNKTIELDNICSWVFLHKTTSWMRSLNFFFCIVFATTRSKMIWKQLASTKQLWSFKNELHVIIIHDCSVLKVACDHKDQRNWKLCYTPVCSQLEIRSSIKRYSFQSC